MTGTIDDNGIVLWNNDKVNGKKTPLISQITAENYGDVVNYPVNLDDNEDTNDWKIFYSDEENVYIIPSDYVNVNAINKEKESFEIYVSGKYVTYWKSGPRVIESDWDKNKGKYLMSNYNSLWSTNAYENFKCVTTMLKTDSWTEFLDSEDGKGLGEWAIGGPTIEMYVESWNAKGYTKLFCNNTNQYGYYIGNTDKPTTTYQAMKNDAEGYADTLYYPHVGDSDYEGCAGYWLASPSAYDTARLLAVRYNGNISDYGYYYVACYAFRPIVMLNKDVGATSTKTSDGIVTWNISK